MNARDPRRIAIALVAAGGVLACATLTLATAAPSAFVLARNLLGFAGLRSGESAPEIDATDLSGRPFQLSAQRGKTVVLRFWSPDCAACRSELDSIRATAERYAASPDVAFVTVVSRMPLEQVRQFAAEHGITYPIVLDASGLVADSYLVDALPYTYVLTPEGRVLRGFVGSGNAFQIFREAQTCRDGVVASVCTVKSESVP